ncbi:MAG: Stp1/IreP family PP2C-type Ser/Thr phosphatase [Myxococcota bacterium]
MSFEPGDIEIVSLTDTGRQRSANQDSVGEGVAPDGARLAIVADGMGGHAGGETASRLAVEAVQGVVASSEGAPDGTLREALETANRAVHDESQRNTQLLGMGTTGVAALFSRDAAYVANVGDSRAYRLRDGVIEQLTDDHSLVAELQRRGIISEEEALVHPRRNEVLRSLGVEPEVTVDLFAFELRAGDVFLLCSDGLSGVVRDEEIADVLRREAPAEAVRSLVDFANERGGPDNVTVQIARIPGESGGAGANERERRIRALSLAVVAVALLLSLALVWALWQQLGGASDVEPPAVASDLEPAPDVSEEHEVDDLLPPEPPSGDE